jgi:hypothetical protein
MTIREDGTYGYDGRTMGGIAEPGRSRSVTAS